MGLKGEDSRSAKLFLVLFKFFYSIEKNNDHYIFSYPPKNRNDLSALICEEEQRNIMLSYLILLRF